MNESAEPQEGLLNMSGCARARADTGRAPPTWLQAPLSYVRSRPRSRPGRDARPGAARRTGRGSSSPPPRLGAPRGCPMVRVCRARGSRNSGPSVDRPGQTFRHRRPLLLGSSSTVFGVLVAVCCQSAAGGTDSRSGRPVGVRSSCGTGRGARPRSCLRGDRGRGRWGRLEGQLSVEWGSSCLRSSFWRSPVRF